MIWFDTIWMWTGPPAYTPTSTCRHDTNKKQNITRFSAMRHPHKQWRQGQRPCRSVSRRLSASVCEASFVCAKAVGLKIFWSELRREQSFFYQIVSFTRLLKKNTYPRVFVPGNEMLRADRRIQNKMRILLLSRPPFEVTLMLHASCFMLHASAKNSPGQLLVQEKPTQSQRVLQ